MLVNSFRKKEKLLNIFKSMEGKIVKYFIIYRFVNEFFIIESLSGFFVR